METLTKDIRFDPTKGELWLNVMMIGLLRMDYEWDLYSKKDSEPFKLTIQSRTGNNSTPENNCYPLKSDYAPNEPVAEMDNRYVGLMMGIIGQPGDIYQFIVDIKQGAEYETATPLGNVCTPVDQVMQEDTNYCSYRCEINFYVPSPKVQPA